MKPEGLGGKTALVTGAAKRIGHEIAIALAKEGVNVVAHYRASADEAIALCTELADRGVKAWPLKADLAKPEECEGLIARAREIAGRLDLLINSASVFLPGTLEEMQLKDLTRHMQVNAWAPFVLSREFARTAGRGKIVNLLDTRVGGYDWSHAAYILSKHALWVLTKMTAVAFAPDITVNGVAPGLILPPPGEDDSYLDRLTHTVPLKRHGEPADVAQAVIYLLKSDFVTGEVIRVDGGRHLWMDVAQRSNGRHSSRARQTPEERRSRNGTTLRERP